MYKEVKKLENVSHVKIDGENVYIRDGNGVTTYPDEKTIYNGKHINFHVSKDVFLVEINYEGDKCLIYGGISNKINSHTKLISDSVCYFDNQLFFFRVAYSLDFQTCYLDKYSIPDGKSLWSFPIVFNSLCFVGEKVFVCNKKTIYCLNNEN